MHVNDRTRYLTQPVIFQEMLLLGTSTSHSLLALLQCLSSLEEKVFKKRDGTQPKLA